MSSEPSDEITIAGATKRIYLNALREFAEDCAGPEHQHQCPYVVQTGEIRTCAEECADILDAHDDGAKTGHIELGDGLSATEKRNRPEIGRSRKQAKPFDAKELHLADSPLAIDQRSATALLLELEKMFRESHPWKDSDAAKTIDAMLDELARRGFDSEKLLRGPLLPSIAIGAMLPALVAFIELENGRPIEQISDDGQSGWELLLFGDGKTREKRLLDAKKNGPVDMQGLIRLLSERTNMAERWLVDLSIGDLVVAKPPPADWLPGIGQLVSGADDETQWLYDRFTKTYLDKWYRPSLHLEWDYVTGVHRPPVLEASPRNRSIDRVDIALAIAGVGPEVEHETQDSQLTVKLIAMKLLADGNREAAATAFSVQLQTTPNDAETLNNYAFCILPDDPAKALKTFEQLAVEKRGREDLNVANRMHALRLLGKRATALALAENFWERHGSVPMELCWLWTNSMSAEPRVTLVSSNEYVYSIAATMALDSSDAHTWKLRLEETSSRAPSSGG